MGLIRAGIGALGGVLADQWKEFFYCDSIDNDVLLVKGQKRTGGRSSNTKGSDNVISNGSGIAVADGQCMIIVEQGKVVEVCAEPGEFTYDSSTEPSIFSGKLGDSIKETFKTVGKRFTYGGDTGKDQRVYYINTKEILENKFGTPNPFMFDVVYNKKRRTVEVRCSGVYSYIITDPLLFYTKISGNIADEYRREQLDGQLKTEFISALQPAFAVLSELELRPSQIPAHTVELKDALNKALKVEWTDRRGISVESIALNPISLTEEDLRKIKSMEDASEMGSDPFMMAGRMADSSAEAAVAAANNPNGAMTGFMGMGMAMNGMGGGGFNAAQGFYNMGVQQQQMQQQQMQQQQMAQQQAPQAGGWTCACGNTVSGNFCPNCGGKKPAPQPAAGSWTCSCGNTVSGKFCTNCGAQKPAEEGWTCSCGAVNKGKFCQNCGAQKPAGAPLYQCDKCGWKPEDPNNVPKFCPECGDIFDGSDIK